MDLQVLGVCFSLGVYIASVLFYLNLVKNFLNSPLFLIIILEFLPTDLVKLLLIAVF